MVRRLTVCMLSCIGCVTAQRGPLRVQTNVVQVPVIVTDKDGRNVDGLVARDFSVLDNGVRQEVSMDDFGAGLAPISLAIAIQTSGISTPALAKVRNIGGLIQPLVTGARGEVSVVTFDSQIKVLQDFTPDDDKIRSAVKNLKPASSMDRARMIDAIVEVARHMQDRQGRKVLLLISETRDRGSETTFQQCMEEVEHQGIEVFSAHYSAYATSLLAKPREMPSLPPPGISGDPADWPGAPPGVDFLAIFAEIGHLAKTNALQALTRVTGGSDFSFAKESGIESAIGKLGLELHSQYVLSFPQRRSGVGIHQIEVLVPRRDDLRIRSRRSYWADPDQ